MLLLHVFGSLPVVINSFIASDNYEKTIMMFDPLNPAIFVARKSRRMRSSVLKETRSSLFTSASRSTASSTMIPRSTSWAATVITMGPIPFERELLENSLLKSLIQIHPIHANLARATRRATSSSRRIRRRRPNKHRVGVSQRRIQKEEEKIKARQPPEEGESEVEAARTRSQTR